jgi:ribosomal protein S18 acetylase RimI-like enzyme
MNGFILRQASTCDIPFLVDTIIEAEKSGTSILTYTTIFGLTETDARDNIAKMLNEEIDGCELSVSGFILAENNGKIAGAVGAWIEGSEGIPSNVLKGNLLSFVLPSFCLDRARRLSNIVSDLHIDYVNDTIQIGLVYVAPEARGMGLVQLLIDQKVRLLKEKYPQVKEVYIQVFGNNLQAIRAYEKVGFKIIYERIASVSETANYMPDTRKVLMHKFI